MSPRITLRLIGEGDLEWARTLRNASRHYFFDSSELSKAQHKKWFEKLDYPFFVIEGEGTRIGTIAVRQKKDGTEIHNVIIDSPYRGRGILRDAIEILESRYGKPLYLDVAPHNTRAVVAYKRLGFTVVSHRLEKK